MKRISHRRCSIKINILKNFAKFTGKHLCERWLKHRCFPVNFAKFLRIPFLQSTPELQVIFVNNNLTMNLSSNSVNFKHPPTRNNLSINVRYKLRTFYFFGTRLPFCKININFWYDSFWQNLNIIHFLGFTKCLLILHLVFGCCLYYLTTFVFYLYY